MYPVQVWGSCCATPGQVPNTPNGSTQICTTDFGGADSSCPGLPQAGMGVVFSTSIKFQPTSGSTMAAHSQADLLHTIFPPETSCLPPPCPCLDSCFGQHNLRSSVSMALRGGRCESLALACLWVSCTKVLYNTFTKHQVQCKGIEVGKLSGLQL